MVDPDRIDEARRIIRSVVRKWPLEAPDARRLREALALLEGQPSDVPPADDPQRCDVSRWPD